MAARRGGVCLGGSKCQPGVPAVLGEGTPTPGVKLKPPCSTLQTAPKWGQGLGAK